MQRVQRVRPQGFLEVIDQSHAHERGRDPGQRANERDCALSIGGECGNESRSAGGSPAVSRDCMSVALATTEIPNSTAA